MIRTYLAHASTWPEGRLRTCCSVGLLSLGLVGAGGPASAAGTNAVTGVPAFVNIANAGAVEISGTGGPGVARSSWPSTTRTRTPLPSRKTISGAANWSTDPIDLSSLTDGMLTVYSSYDGDGPSSGVDPTLTKDTLEPDSPSALPDDTDVFAAAQQVEIDRAGSGRPGPHATTPSGTSPRPSRPTRIPWYRRSSWCRTASRSRPSRMTRPATPAPS